MGNAFSAVSTSAIASLLVLGLAAFAAVGGSNSPAKSARKLSGRTHSVTPPTENQVMRRLPLSRKMEAVNAFLTAVKSWLGVSVIKLSETSLVRTASKATANPKTAALFGDQTEFISGLKHLVQGIETQSLTPSGVLFFRVFVERLLAVRSSVMKYVTEKPEIAKIAIKQPIIVLGLPRTGSTLLYNLISCDPSTRSPQLWEMYQSIDPVPPTTKAKFLTDERIALLRKRLEDIDMLMPGFFAEISKSHPIKAASPDEELFALFHQLILSLHMAVGGEAFEDWVLDEHNKAYAYTYLKLFIQMLDSGYGPEKHWTLKSPFHALYPQALMDVFPDARVVVTHRELSAVLPSLAKLMETQVQYLYEDKTLDRRVLGRQVMRMTSAMTDRLHAFRGKHANPDQFFDVRYDEIVSDPVGTVKGIYKHFGLVVSAEHESLMRTYLAENPQGRHGRAAYEAEDYGLSKREINTHFADYVNNYLVIPPPSTTEL